MKVYLILQYNKNPHGDVWADVWAYTSATQRNKALASHPTGDVEPLDVEVQKRPYTTTRDLLVNDLVETKVPVDANS